MLSDSPALITSLVSMDPGHKNRISHVRRKPNIIFILDIKRFHCSAQGNKVLLLFHGMTPLTTQIHFDAYHLQMLCSRNI